MPVSVVEIIESFQLGLPLPIPTEELPAHATEQSVRDLAEHFLMARLHQLRSHTVREMSEECNENALGKEVKKIVTKHPSERTPSEVSFLQDTYEEANGEIADYVQMVFEMYYGTKAVLEADDVRDELWDQLQGSQSCPDSPEESHSLCNLSGFLRYYTELGENTTGGRAFMKRISYYSDLIAKLRESHRDYHGLNEISYGTTRYSRDDALLEERRILKEYVDRYLPGPILCTMY